MPQNQPFMMRDRDDFVRRFVVDFLASIDRYAFTPSQQHQQ